MTSSKYEGRQTAQAVDGLAKSHGFRRTTLEALDQIGRLMTGLIRSKQ